MRCPSYGLILSLSLLLFAGGISAQEEEKATAPANAQKPTQTIKEPAAADKKNSPKEEPAKQALDTGLETENAELQKNMKDLNDRFNGLNAAYMAVMEQLNSYAAYVDTTSLAADLQGIRNEQQRMQESLAILSARQIKLEEDVDVFKNSTGTVMMPAAGTQSIKKENVKATGVSIDERNGQQYVKLKVMDNGQEVELILDPTYVDMNLNLEKGRSKGQPGTKTAEKDNVNKVMEDLAKELEKVSRSHYETVPANQPPSAPGGYTAAAPASSNELTTPESGAVPPEQGALEELYKAQKLFYEKKYNASLNAVQRSLSTQETALGYALEGSLYFTMGDNELAINSWEQALKLNPNMTEVKKALFKYKR